MMREEEGCSRVKVPSCPKSNHMANAILRDSKTDEDGEHNFDIILEQIEKHWAQDFKTNPSEVLAVMQLPSATALHDSFPIGAR